MKKSNELWHLTAAFNINIKTDFLVNFNKHRNQLVEKNHLLSVEWHHK